MPFPERPRPTCAATNEAVHDGDSDCARLLAVRTIVPDAVGHRASLTAMRRDAAKGDERGEGGPQQLDAAVRR